MLKKIALVITALSAFAVLEWIGVPGGNSVTGVDETTTTTQTA